jgi:hypothetical protein
MIRLATLSILILVLFGNCHRESVDMKVTYKVRETSLNVPQFNVTYTADKSGSTSSVSSSAPEWDSPALVLSRGEFVSMTLDCTAPNFDFILDILVDGGIFREVEMHNPTSTITISGNIGN